MYAYICKYIHIFILPFSLPNNNFDSIIITSLLNFNGNNGRVLIYERKPWSNSVEMWKENESDFCRLTITKLLASCLFFLFLFQHDYAYSHFLNHCQQEIVFTFLNYAKMLENKD